MSPKRIDPSNCTLHELVYLRTGSLRATAKVTLFINCWAIARRDLGHEPTVDEYAAFWKQSRRTAFRDQDAFRRAFPNLETPAPICELLEHAERPADFSGLAVAGA